MSASLSAATMNVLLPAMDAIEKSFSVIAWIFSEMTIWQIPLFCVILKVVMFYANCQLQSWAS